MSDDAVRKVVFGLIVISGTWAFVVCYLGWPGRGRRK